MAGALKDDLRYLRTQIVVYRAQHKDCPPGYPNGDRTQAATGADFIAQMTRPSDEDGITASQPGTAYKLGPYLSQMPVNPSVSSSARIRTSSRPRRNRRLQSLFRKRSCQRLWRESKPS